ncbi:MAG: hypothetical protein ACXVIB_07325 [Halobacteriota archaeon]
MSTYIMLMQWTKAGIDKIKELPQRLERARTTFRTHVVVSPSQVCAIDHI